MTLFSQVPFDIVQIKVIINTKKQKFFVNNCRQPSVAIDCVRNKGKRSRHITTATEVFRSNKH